MTSPREPAPINDEREARQLEQDPQLREVERLERSAEEAGLPNDEAQAAAWAEVNRTPEAEAARRSADPHHPPEKRGNGDVSVGG
ncbi:MAG: hypothetical protein PGN26_13310 [Xylophilus ampelinus]